MSKSTGFVFSSVISSGVSSVEGSTMTGSSTFSSGISSLSWLFSIVFTVKPQNNLSKNPSFGLSVSEETSPPGVNEGFFDKLFGGFTVKTVENNQESEEVPEENVEEPVVIEPSTEETPEEITEENTNPVDFDIGIRYQDSPFTTINITNVDNIWYTLNIRNKESFVVKCNVNHYVNDGLKDDKSTVTIEAGNERDINLREMAS